MQCPLTVVQPSKAFVQRLVTLLLLHDLLDPLRRLAELVHDERKVPGQSDLDRLVRLQVSKKDRWIGRLRRSDHRPDDFLFLLLGTENQSLLAIMTDSPVTHLTCVTGTSSNPQSSTPPNASRALRCNRLTSLSSISLSSSRFSSYSPSTSFSRRLLGLE